MSNGIPLELFTMLFTTGVGGILKIWAQAIQAKDAQNKRLMAVAAKNAQIYKEAREHEGPTRSTGFHWTRRTIALLAVAFIICLPKILVIWMPEIAVTVGYHELKRGFLFFWEDAEKVKWVAQQGFVITPLDTHLMSAIVGLFFGSEICKR